MIRQNFCTHCKQVTNQKTVKMFTVTVTTCQRCSTTLRFEYSPRKTLQTVKARKMTKPVKISFMVKAGEQPRITDKMTKPVKISWLAKDPPAIRILEGKQRSEVS